MKRRNLRMLLLGSGLVALLGFFGQSAQAATIVADDNVSIRVAPDEGSEKVGSVLKGQIMDIMDAKDGWYQILWNGEAAYTPMDRWTGYAASAKIDVYFRQAANIGAPALGQIKAGSEVIVLGRCGDWLQVEHGGLRGFSWSGRWNVSTAFLEDLPFVLDGTTAMSLPQEEQGSSAVLLKSAGDQYQIISALPGYETSADAKVGEEHFKTLQPGTYYVYQVAQGMYNLTENPTEPGTWMDPATNRGRVFPETPEVTIAEPSEASADFIKQPILSPPAPTPPSAPVEAEAPKYEVGDRFVVKKEMPAYRSSADAKAGKDPALTLSSDDYRIYKIQKGMLNISRSREEAGAWINPGGQTTAGTLDITNKSTIGERAVKEAKKLLGAPYIFGAESWTEGGFDCSGLTQYVYSRLGIAIPRTATWQWEGIKRKVETPRPGDLIIFSRNGEIYHVGLYIGGNEMIHAPKPGDVVKISSLDSWYSGGLVKGYLRPYKD